MMHIRADLRKDLLQSLLVSRIQNRILLRQEMAILHQIR